MEIISGKVNDVDLEKMISYIIDFFQKQNQQRTKTMYGWNSNIHIDNWYKYIEIDTTQLDTFIHKSIKEKKFIFGHSDLFIETLDEKFKFLFCHESDVHFESKNRDLIMKVKNAFKSMGYRVYVAKKFVPKK